MTHMNKMLIIGHGYTAGFLTPLLRAENWQVIGTTRANRARVAAAGASPLLWPGEDDALGHAIDQADGLLVTVPPTANGDPVLAEMADRIAKSRIKWIGYLSTTSVYGDRGGEWVDEDSSLTPSSARGEQRAAAEAEWQEFAAKHNVPLHIFRLAGIYGPGRGPFVKVREGSARRIIKPGQVFSRIHAEDIAATLMASIKAPHAGAIYNLCDDNPAPPEDVIAYAANLIGAPVPPDEDFTTADMTQMARSFYLENKRVRNDRIKTELGINLRYPDYRTGLDAIAKEAS